jgi:hypothetical protein
MSQSNAGDMMTTLKLRPVREMHDHDGETVLALHRSGNWSVVKIDKSWRRTEADCWGLIDGRTAYEVNKAYAEMFCFRERQFAGWVALGDIGELLRPHPAKLA